jgi:hypothetical protein
MPLKWDGPLPQSLGKEGELWIFLTEAHWASGLDVHSTTEMDLERRTQGYRCPTVLDGEDFESVDIHSVHLLLSFLSHVQIKLLRARNKATQIIKTKCLNQKNKLAAETAKVKRPCNLSTSLKEKYS